MIKCNYCTYESKTQRGVDIHTKKKHPKQREQDLLLQEQSKPHQCPKCVKGFDSKEGLQKHLARTHKIKGMESYMLLNNITEIPKCNCGCGEELNYFSSIGFGEYIRGHIARVNGGFYSEEGAKKSAETRRERFQSGEIEVWNKNVDLRDYWGDEKYEVWLEKYKTTERNKKLSDSMKESRAKRAGYKNWQEWYDSLDEREKYYYEVRKLTEQNVHLVPNYDESKRLLAGIKGAHHIDHIISITKGFKQGIPPEDIAHPDNLRFIPWQDNLQKGGR